MAVLITQISSASAALTWMLTEWMYKDYPTLLGMISGAVAGLVAVTPAAGYIDQTGAFVIGTICGPVCYYGVHLKHVFGFEDALDAFGTHAIAGTLGGILTGLLAKRDVGGVDGALYGNPQQLGYQLAGILFSIGWSGIVTYFILEFIEHIFVLRSDLVYGTELNDSEHEEIVAVGLVA